MAKAASLPAGAGKGLSELRSLPDSSGAQATKPNVVIRITKREITAKWVLPNIALSPRIPLPIHIFSWQAFANYPLSTMLVYGLNCFTLA